MFVAIEGENRALAEFAESSRSAGLSRGFYRHFPRQEIAKLEREADHYDGARLEAEGRAFYTERGWSEVAPAYFERLRGARAAAAKLEEEISAERRGDDLQAILRTIRRPRGLEPTGERSERPGPWTEGVRDLLGGALAFADRGLARRVAQDLVEHFDRLTGVKLDGLGPRARRELETLVEESGRPQAGGRR
jgi:hypothetical protein